MSKEKDFFNLLFCCNYTIFISNNYVYEKDAESVGGIFIKSVNNKCSCGIAAGLKLAGIRSIIILDDDLYEFIRIYDTFCKTYLTHIACITSADVNKIKELLCVQIIDNYENKVKRRLKEVDNNSNSLVLGWGVKDE